ncbi:GrpB family protein [Nocardioides sp. CER19]|uniref:GrpB family protein n=1 Tax=Nocardioides sp. CER19 TaxID=3038538 RepID=UPI00244CACE6|nr:GrpB family protein [Nocardioides sp. CER19]MDH2413263.1 GrpB family protein [Nocardioides sp. CER19]
MAVEVVAYDSEWPARFESVAVVLRTALGGVPTARVEHVGSTSVPGLAAKPILDIDVIVERPQVARAIAVLESVGYVHRGDLGVTDREAFLAPDEDPRRHVYVCVAGTLNVRNHLAVRDVLRGRADLRDEYAAVKRSLAADPDMDITTYIAAKSDVLQRVLEESSLVTAAERAQILAVNGSASTPTARPATGGRGADR